MATVGVVSGAPVMLNSFSNICQVRTEGGVRFGGVNVELGYGLAEAVIKLPGQGTSKRLIATDEGVGAQAIKESYIRRMINDGAMDVSPEIVAGNAQMLRTVRISEKAFAKMDEAALRADYLLYLMVQGNGQMRGRLFPRIPHDIECKGTQMQIRRSFVYYESVFNLDTSLPITYNHMPLMSYACPNTESDYYPSKARVFRMKGYGGREWVGDGLPLLTPHRPIAISMSFASWNQPRFGHLYCYSKVDSVVRWILLRSIEKAAGDGADRRMVMFDIDENIHY